MASYDDVYGLTYMAAKQAMSIRAQAISEREKKRTLIWEGIERCIAKEDENGVARYMDILNKMDSEYININRNIEDKGSDIANLDIEALKKLSEDA